MKHPMNMHNISQTPYIYPFNVTDFISLKELVLLGVGFTYRYRAFT
jgi:hypothetical protein